MKPETALFFRKSHEFLTKAQELLDAHHWSDEAGRAAYLAGFHAAQALLFETHNRVFKTHKGVRAEFLRLTKTDPRVDGELRAFLGRAYDLKAIADYETGPGSKVSAESARAALKTARRFGECVTRLLPANGHTPRAPGATPKP
ncbi:MAG TPA: HEPN domain-containing protein [Methylocystis sp.]|nr:HEPN domain-containing protein [Methylocystis sp.]